MTNRYEEEQRNIRELIEIAQVEELMAQTNRWDEEQRNIREVIEWEIQQEEEDNEVPF